MPVAMIIFGAKSGIVSRIVHCDTMDELAGGQHYRSGDGIIILDPKAIMTDGMPDLYRCKALVAEARGQPAEDNRCVVIDNATAEIVGVKMADPSLDVEADGLTLFQDAKAAPGWVIDEKGDFVAPAKLEELEAIPKDGG